MNKSFLKKTTWSRKKLMIVAAPVVAVSLIVVILIVSLMENQIESVYRETTAVYGDLTVGITEDGSVSIGTVTQTFDLDISEYVATESTAGTQTGSIWGGGAMGGMSFGAEATSASTSSASDREMEIEEVYVTVGQQVTQGDAILKLTDETVEAIRSELETDVTDAQLTVDQLVISQKSSRLSAQHTYESNLAYSSFAQSDYDQAIALLNETYTDTQESLTEAQEILVTLQSELVEKQAEYDQAVQALADAAYGVDTVDKLNNIYWYMEYESIRESAATFVDNLEDELETATQAIEDQTDTITELENKLKKAEIEISSGTAKAKAEYDTTLLSGNMAQEAYDVSIAYLDVDMNEAQDDLAEAQEKLETFDSYVVNNELLAASLGVITTVAVAGGDTITTDDSLITLNAWDDVTMEATVSEDDIGSVVVDDTVNITLDSFTDTAFTGVITEIADAVTDSSTGEITYAVTVTLQGDVSQLYEGMTGDITFITKESEEVVYVANRAVIRDGSKSYVKIKDSEGSIVKQEVTTGFSDGINVEITEGLSEGDIVLIESKVSE